MIDYLRGCLLVHDGDAIILDVNGVGYGVLIKPDSFGEPDPDGPEIEIWIRTYVREDILKLYGFVSRHERDMFDLLISMPGIGPSLGMSILSSLGLADIVQAVHEDNSAVLRSIRGVGPRMAEKLMLELKSKIGKMSGIVDPGSKRDSVAVTGDLSGNRSDAVDALLALGVRSSVAGRAISQAAGRLGVEASTEDLVREGLKHR